MIFHKIQKNNYFLSINAVFDSWNNQRAIVYRRLNKIPDHLGTAVNIQSMVFGNMGNDSGTGVAFTRNPSTGEADTLWRIFNQCSRGRCGCRDSDTTSQSIY